MRRAGGPSSSSSAQRSLTAAAINSERRRTVSIYETLAHYGLPIVRDPLHRLGYSQLSLPIFGGPIGDTLVNETAKTLPVQNGDTVELEPFANNRLLIARINRSGQDRTLDVDSAVSIANGSSRSGTPTW